MANWQLSYTWTAWKRCSLIGSWAGALVRSVRVVELQGISSLTARQASTCTHLDNKQGWNEGKGGGGRARGRHSVSYIMPLKKQKGKVICLHALLFSPWSLWSWRPVGWSNIWCQVPWLYTDQIRKEPIYKCSYGSGAGGCGQNKGKAISVYYWATVVAEPGLVLYSTCECVFSRLRRESLSLWRRWICSSPHSESRCSLLTHRYVSLFPQSSVNVFNPHFWPCISTYLYSFFCIT